MTGKLLTLLTLVILPAACMAQSGPTTAPATAAVTTMATAPAATVTGTTAPAVDPAVRAVLEKLEAGGMDGPNLLADIDYRVDMLQVGDSEQRQGKVYYQSPEGAKSAKFRIHFDTLQQGNGAKIKDPVDYAFDGQWLTVRKERIKQQIRYQVAAPGQQVAPLELGKGPFPVPFGQKADNMLERFDIVTRTIKKDEPDDTQYVKLTTKPKYKDQLSLVWIEMWVRLDGLPAKIVAEDRSENRTTVVFGDKEGKINKPDKFPADTFDLPKPPGDWEYRVETYKGKQ